MPVSRIRITSSRAAMAEAVLARATGTDAGPVIDACNRVRHGWLYGRLVHRSDIALVAAFA